MMKAKLFICAVALAAALFPADVSADERKGPKHSKGQRVFAELGVTPEQEAKLRDLNIKAASSKKVQIKELEVLREKIKAELQKEKPSKSALNKYASDVGNLHKQMNLAAIDHLLKAKAVLTPEQFARLSERGFIGGGPDGMRVKMHKYGGPYGGPSHRYGPPPPHERKHPDGDGPHKFKGGKGGPGKWGQHPYEGPHEYKYMRESDGAEPTPPPAAPAPESVGEAGGEAAE